MEYINKYANAAEIQAAVDDATLGHPYIALNDSLNKIDWDSYATDYSSMYLTIQALSDGDFHIWGSGVSYSINEETWETTTDEETTLELYSGDKVRFKKTAGTASLDRNSDIDFKVYGNAMSMEYGDNFSGQTVAVNASGFSYFFYNCQALLDASNLILPATSLESAYYEGMFYECTNLNSAPALPATTLADSCYSSMFDGCSSLVKAPELPATTLANGCYSMMFYNCTSLTTTPSVLPATTLAENCYKKMFRNCSSLTTAPELPATTLADGCYDNMFRKCESLNYIKCLATDISATNCTKDWVIDVSTTGTFVKAASMNDWTTGENGIPDGWTVIEE